MWFKLLVVVFGTLVVLNLLIPQKVFLRIELRRTSLVSATKKKKGKRGWAEWIRKFSIEELRICVGMVTAFVIALISIIVLSLKDPENTEFARQSLSVCLGYLLAGATSARK